MSEAPIRLLLRDECSRGDVERALLGDGWQLVNVFLRGPSWPSQVVFGSSARDAWVHYVDDDRSGARYLCIVGDEPGTVEAALRERIGLWDRAAITELVRSSTEPAALTTALRRAALAAPPDPRDAAEEEETLAILDMGVAHPDATVGQAAVQAFGCVPWPSIDRRLLEIAEQHAVDSVRAAARAVAASRAEPPT